MKLLFKISITMLLCLVPLSLFSDDTIHFFNGNTLKTNVIKVDESVLEHSEDGKSIKRDIKRESVSHIVYKSGEKYYFTDIIILKNNKQIRCKVLGEKEGVVEYTLPGSEIKKQLSMKQVYSIEYSDPDDTLDRRSDLFYENRIIPLVDNMRPVNQFQFHISYGYIDNPAVNTFRNDLKARVESEGFIISEPAKKEDPNLTGGAYLEYRRFPFSSAGWLGYGGQFGMLVDRSDFMYRRASDSEAKIRLNVTSMEIPVELYFYSLFRLAKNWDFVLGVGGNYRPLYMWTVIERAIENDDLEFEDYDKEKFEDIDRVRHSYGVQGKIELGYRVPVINCAITYSVLGYYNWQDDGGEMINTKGIYFFNLGVRTVF